jgi:hypothetical protein
LGDLKKKDFYLKANQLLKVKIKWINFSSIVWFYGLLQVESGCGRAKTQSLAWTKEYNSEPLRQQEWFFYII